MKQALGWVGVAATACLVACGPQVVVSTGATTVQSQGGDAAGASASNSAAGGAASNEASQSAGASAGAGAQAGAGAGVASGGGGAAGSPAPMASASGGAGPAPGTAAPSASPSPRMEIPSGQLLWSEDFEGATASAVPGWQGLVGSVESWRGLRPGAKEGLVSLVFGDGQGLVLAKSGTAVGELRRAVDLRGVKAPRLRLWTSSGGSAPHLVQLSLSLGPQSMALPAGAGWVEQDVDLGAWAGNEGQLKLEAKVIKGPADLQGPAVDHLRLYDAGR